MKEKPKQRHWQNAMALIGQCVGVVIYWLLFGWRDSFSRVLLLFLFMFSHMWVGSEIGKRLDRIIRSRSSP